jgi:uncharacterized protein (TIGR02246 family)
MHSDEEEIRQLVTAWMTATKAGDTQAVLELMTDDAVFLVPGRPPFGKTAFAQAAQTQSASSLQFDGRSEIEEIKVHGDWAFMRSHLTVIAMPREGDAVTRAGHTLTILRRENGRWKLARDANLLVPAAKPADAA